MDLKVGKRKKPKSKTKNSTTEVFVLPPNLLMKLGINLKSEDSVSSLTNQKELKHTECEEIQKINQESRPFSLEQNMDDTMMETAKLMKKSIFLSPTFVSNISNIPGEIEVSSVYVNTVPLTEIINVDNREVMSCELSSSLDENKNNSTVINEIVNENNVKKKSEEKSKSHLQKSTIVKNTSDNYLKTDNTSSILDNVDPKKGDNIANDESPKSALKVKNDEVIKKPNKINIISEQIIDDSQINKIKLFSKLIGNTLTPVAVDAVISTSTNNDMINKNLVLSEFQESNNNLKIDENIKVNNIENLTKTTDHTLTSRETKINTHDYIEKGSAFPKERACGIDKANENIIISENAITPNCLQLHQLTHENDQIQPMANNDIVAENESIKLSENSLNAVSISPVTRNLPGTHDFTVNNSELTEDVDQEKNKKQCFMGPKIQSLNVVNTSQIISMKKHIGDNEKTNGNNEIMVQEIPINEHIETKSKLCIQGVEKPGGEYLTQSNSTHKEIKTYFNRNRRIKSRNMSQESTPSEQTEYKSQDNVSDFNIEYSDESSDMALSFKIQTFCICYDFGRMEYYDNIEIYEHIHYLKHDLSESDVKTIFEIYSDENVTTTEARDAIQCEEIDNVKSDVSFCWHYYDCSIDDNSKEIHENVESIEVVDQSKGSKNLDIMQSGLIKKKSNQPFTEMNIIMQDFDSVQDSQDLLPEKFQEKNNIVDEEENKCAVCNKIIVKEIWESHVAEEHCHIAWRSGSALDFEDETLLSNLRQKMKTRGYLTCTFCPVQKFKKLKKFLIHVKECLKFKGPNFNQDSSLKTKCGVCSLEVETSKWIDHIAIVHSYKAWKDGDDPLDLENEKAINTHLQKFCTHFGGLNCSRCGVHYKFLKYYLAHQKVCKHNMVIVDEHAARKNILKSNETEVLDLNDRIRSVSNVKTEYASRFRNKTANNENNTLMPIKKSRKSTDTKNDKQIHSLIGKSDAVNYDKLSNNSKSSPTENKKRECAQTLSHKTNNTAIFASTPIQKTQKSKDSDIRIETSLKNLQGKGEIVHEDINKDSSAVPIETKKRKCTKVSSVDNEMVRTKSVDASPPSKKIKRTTRNSCADSNRSSIDLKQNDAASISPNKNNDILVASDPQTALENAQFTPIQKKRGIKRLSVHTDTNNDDKVILQKNNSEKDEIHKTEKDSEHLNKKTKRGRLFNDSEDDKDLNETNPYIKLKNHKISRNANLSSSSTKDRTYKNELNANINDSDSLIDKTSNSCQTKNSTSNKTNANAPLKTGLSSKTAEEVSQVENQTENSNKCGVCFEDVPSSSWMDHIADKHYYLAWKEGDTPLKLDDELMLKQYMLEIKEHSKVFTCKKCQLERKYPKAFIKHVQECDPENFKIIEQRSLNASCGFSTSALEFSKIAQTSDKIDAVIPSSEIANTSLSIRHDRNNLQTCIKCGVCSEEVEGDKWPYHIFRYHNYLAWIEGETPIDLNNEEQVHDYLYKINKECGGLTCSKCGLVRKYVKLYLQHIETCKGKLLVFENKTADSIIECAMCNKEIKYGDWKNHAMSEHYNVAWIKGSNPLDLNNFYAVGSLLKEYNKTHKLVCKCCGISRTSHFGFYAHILTCGKSDEDTEQFKETCEVCQNKYLRVYKSQHMAAHREKEHAVERKLKLLELEKSRDSEEVLQDRRKAAVRAMNVIEKYNTSDNKTCAKCDGNTEPGKTHICCKTEDLSDSDVSVKIEDESDLYESDYSDVDSNVSADEEEQLKKRKKEVKEVVTGGLTASRPARMPYSVTDIPSYLQKSYLDYCKKHLTSDILFPEWKKVECVLLPANEANKYLPKLETSCEVKFLENCSWKSFKRFEAWKKDNHYIMFVGGSLQCMSWAPTRWAGEAGVGGGAQYLAVAAHAHGDSPRYNYDETRAHRGLLQIWDFGNITTFPRFVFGLAHEYGVVWSMSWCPSGCREAAQDAEHGAERGAGQLGLLAVACSNGSAYIFSVPYPSTLSDKDSNIYKIKPVAELRLEMTHSRKKYQASSISWSPQKGHSMILVGYSDGTTAQYDITTDSPLLKTTENDITVFYPYYDDRTHKTAVTAVEVFPGGEAGDEAGGEAGGAAVCSGSTSGARLRVGAAAAGAGGRRAGSLATTFCCTGLAFAPHWPSALVAAETTVGVSQMINELEWGGGWRRVGVMRACASCGPCGRLAHAAPPLLRVMRPHPAYTELKKLIVATIEMIPISGRRKLVNDELGMKLEPLEYDEAVKEYGVQIKKIGPKDRKAMSKATALPSTPFPERFPLADITCLAFCPALTHHDYLAVGLHSGLLILLSL